MERPIIGNYFLTPIILGLLLVACSHKPLLSNAGYVIDRNNINIKSWKELNEQHVVMQKYDYSCGAASLATLMKYYFHEDISEQQLINHIKNMFSKSEYAVIEKEGLSLLELEKISRSKGYQSASIRLQLKSLYYIKGPVIVFLQGRGYRHFAVLRGIKEDRVFLADPSRGNIRLSVGDFSKEWQGETFILGKKGFGIPINHRLMILHEPGFRHELISLRTTMVDHSSLRIRNHHDYLDRIFQ